MGAELLVFHKHEGKVYRIVLFYFILFYFI